MGRNSGLLWRPHAHIRMLHMHEQHHGETTETSQARLSPGTGPVNIWLQQTEILTTQPVKLSADVVAYFFCGVYQHPSAVSSTDLLYV